MPFLTEPLEIVECIGPSTFQLRDGTKWNARKLVHVFKAPAPSPDTSSFIHDAPIKLKSSLIRIWINLRRTMILLVCPCLIWSWKIHVLLLRVPSVTDVILLNLEIMKSISKYLM